MTTTDRTTALPPTPRGYGAAIFLVAMGLALATTSGAILTAAGHGDLQDAVRMMGFSRGADLEAGQRQQAAALARFESELQTLVEQIAALKSRPSDTRDDTAVSDHLARLDADLVQLRTETSELRTAQVATQVATPAAEPWREQFDDLKASLALTGFEIGALRSSLDAGDHTRRKEVVDIGRRVDRLERLIVAADASGSIGSSSSARGRALRAARRSSVVHSRPRAVRAHRPVATTMSGQNGSHEPAADASGWQRSWVAAPEKETYQR